MKKSELKQRTDIAISNICEALQIVYNTLNRGQQVQLLKNRTVKSLFDRYNVKY